VIDKSVDWCAVKARGLREASVAAKTLLAMGLVLCAMTVQAQTMEFKGVPFGATEARFKQTLPKFYCDKAKEITLGDRVCIATDDDKIDFGGVIAESIVAGFLRDQLVTVMVRVRGDELGKVLLAIESKYGRALESRAGTTFEWVTTDGVRITAKRGIDGTIWMKNDAAVREIMERSGAAGAKSL
jgi:hypothetical protein